MYKYSNSSKRRLATCHPDLQEIFNEAIKRHNVTILCGHRGEEEQNKAYKSGNSKLKYPKSKHNSYPSIAIDAGLYPIDWNDIPRWKEFAQSILDIAKEKGIPLKSGGLSWGWDYPHFELTAPGTRTNVEENDDIEDVKRLLAEAQAILGKLS